MPPFGGVKTHFFFRRNDERKPLHFFPLPQPAKGVFGAFSRELHYEKKHVESEVIFCESDKSGRKITWPPKLVSMSHQKITQPGKEVTIPGREVTMSGKMSDISGRLSDQPGRISTKPGRIGTKPGRMST